MKIALGADHKGFPLKQQVREYLESLGHQVVDFGTTDAEHSVDFPDYGIKVARAVASGEVDRGITVCWTGNGMNIAANKVHGVRAALAFNPEMARLTRQHNDANVITLSDKYTPHEQVEEIVRVFLETAFEGGRHVARVAKITAAEE
jgi:RpiB/LacA/LacB family sugar-phosphate isomerase